MIVKTPNNYEPVLDGEGTPLVDLHSIEKSFCSSCQTDGEAVGFECQHYGETCFPEDTIHPDTIKALKKRGDHE